jgi:hypothetical protein
MNSLYVLINGVSRCGIQYRFRKRPCRCFRRVGLGLFKLLRNVIEFSLQHLIFSLFVLQIFVLIYQLQYQILLLFKNTETP